MRKESSRRRATVTTLVGGTARTLLVTLQAIVLIPLYISHIGPRLYGAWLGSGDFLVWMQAFDLGLPNLMIQRVAMAYGKNDHRGVGDWFGTGTVVLAGVAGIIAVAGIGISFPLPVFFGLTGAAADQLRQCFRVATIAASLNLFNEGFVGFSRAVQDTTFMNCAGIVATLVSFAVSIWMILAGFGLWALPIGLTARAIVALAGSVIFVLRYYRDDVKRHFSFNRSVAREFVVISPATALGGLSYSLMTQSDTAIIGIFLGPELGTVYSVTRKAMDAARVFIDQIAFAAYGGFAHLVSSPERRRALEVHAEIRSIRLWLAISGATVCMAVNEPLVRLWVGDKQFGGAPLTILLAFQMIVVGQAYLINYLYRAAGSVTKGSLALVAEAAGRTPLALVLMLWLGLPGLPLGAILAGCVSGFILLKWTKQELSTFAAPERRTPLRTSIARAFVVSVGIIVCLSHRIDSWYSLVSVALALGTTGMIVLLMTDPHLNSVRTQLQAWLWSKAPVA